MDSEIERSISAVLDSHEPVTGPEIAAILEEHPLTVQRHCRKLQREGRIRQVAGGAYVRAECPPCREPTASD